LGIPGLFMKFANKMKPEVTIVVPMFNARKSAEKSLASLLRQNYENYEIILVDDYSTDGTYELVKRSVDQSGRIGLKETWGKAGDCSSEKFGNKISKGRIHCFR